MEEDSQRVLGRRLRALVRPGAHRRKPRALGRSPLVLGEDLGCKVKDPGHATKDPLLSRRLRAHDLVASVYQHSCSPCKWKTVNESVLWLIVCTFQMDLYKIRFFSKAEREAWRYIYIE